MRKDETTPRRRYQLQDRIGTSKLKGRRIQSTEERIISATLSRFHKEVVKGDGTQSRESTKVKDDLFEHQGRKNTLMSGTRDYYGEGWK